MDSEDQKVGQTDAQRRAKQKYREKNRERLRAQSIAYNQANRDKIKARNADRRPEIAEYQRQWRVENKDKDLEYAKRYREAHPDRIQEAKFKTRYGITTAEYDALLEKQGGGCAICGTKIPGGNATKHFFVDHDHKTGRVRGLLCNAHNLMLGHAQDLPEILDQGAAYLRAHHSQD